MYSKILVAIDGSKPSFKALGRAIEIGKCWNSEIHAVYAVNPEIYGTTVVDPAIGVSDPGSERIFNMIQEESKKIIEDAKSFTGDQGYDVKYHEKLGDARNVILDTAKDLGVDLIVLGSTGKGMAKRLVLGSVSSSVVFHSPVSTLVVRDLGEQKQKSN
ncbi:universal stress protein [Methanolacinia petrolearia]|uniref:universal stress protein n=1 Tax=Methanolacinia petrolearia TaxID=54120 RepID=UPI003BAD4562